MTDTQELEKPDASVFVAEAEAAANETERAAVDLSVVEPVEAPIAEVPRRRGRPPGSRNAKDGKVAVKARRPRAPREGEAIVRDIRATKIASAKAVLIERAADQAKFTFFNEDGSEALTCTADFVMDRR